jgi:hypothetical protein
LEIDQKAAAGVLLDGPSKCRGRPGPLAQSGQLLSLCGGIPGVPKLLECGEFLPEQGLVLREDVDG